MEAQQRSRYCLECQTRVHDLSAMTEAEAERFLSANADRDDVCLSFVEDHRGSIQFRPSPQPRLVPASGLLRMVPAAALSAALAACTPTNPAPDSVPSSSVSLPHHDEPAPARVAQPTIPTDDDARRLLTHPEDAVPPPPPRVDADEPCDGGASEQPPQETVTKPPPRRLAGKPVVRKKGKIKRPHHSPI